MDFLHPSKAVLKQREVRTGTGTGGSGYCVLFLGGMIQNKHHYDCGPFAPGSTPQQEKIFSMEFKHDSFS
jgi:hypothetical protein